MGDIGSQPAGLPRWPHRKIMAHGSLRPFPAAVKGHARIPQKSALQQGKLPDSRRFAKPGMDGCPMVSTGRGRWSPPVSVQTASPTSRIHGGFFPVYPMEGSKSGGSLHYIVLGDAWGWLGRQLQAQLVEQ